ncbi:polymorphic toxin-type HINT domain-containing protein [Streptomyces sp. NPDC001296]
MLHLAASARGWKGLIGSATGFRSATESAEGASDAVNTPAHKGAPGTVWHRGLRRVRHFPRGGGPRLSTWPSAPAPAGRGHGRAEVIHTTSTHPFYDATTHTWLPAGKLPRGDALNTATDHHAYVVATHPTPGAANRWNLTVQQLHTYYVVAGGTPVLVHNCNDPSDELLDHADANIGKTNVAAEVVAQDGTRGLGVSMARNSEDLTPQVRTAVEATGHHGGCAEIGALCDIEGQGASINGARGQAVHVMGGSQDYGPELHGEVKPFCGECERLFAYLEGGPLE